MTGMKLVLNIQTALFAICSALLGYATWTLTNAYAAAQEEFVDFHSTKAIHDKRIQILETESALRWNWMEKQLAQINSKLDEKVRR